ncbi:MAG: hypothetical protein AAFW98_05115, partial [Pseudomonadota bacterium]
RHRPRRPATTGANANEFQTPARSSRHPPPISPEFEIDSELQAAIEYKIASTGVAGAETVLDLLNVALRRHMS